MFISKIVGAISSKLSPMGELYKESQSGIKIYKHVAKDGKIKLSSFTADGKPFKTIVRENIDNTTFYKNCVVIKNHGHNTEVTNHGTGVVTKIKDVIKNYDYSSLSPKARKGIKYPENVVTREYSYNNHKNGNLVGKLFFKEEFPDRGMEIVSEFDNSGNQIFTEIKKFNILG